MNRIQTSIAAVAIIVLGITGAVILVATKPKAERKKPPRMTPVVQVTKLSPGNQHTQLELMGTVIPAESIDLKSQVAGEVIRTHANWIEGGLLNAGETVIKLEDTDYRIALDQTESELALEMGRQDIAKREWEMLGIRNSSAKDRELALRGPQLRTAQARTEKAKLDLARTDIKAPFNALVQARNLNRGDQANTQIPLGRIVNTDRYHVRISIPVDQLKWIELPRNGKPGSPASILLPDGTSRNGKVIKLLGDLEANGRMARCLVEIKDPLKGEMPVLLNSFVRVRIKGKSINDAYGINRDHFRENSAIWLLTKDSRLKVISIDPLWSDRSRIIFRARIPATDRLITSALSMVVDGMELRLPGEKASKKKQAGKGGGRK